MALPMMISMLVQALYNIVDSIFVARISEEALTAVSMAFPMQNLMIGVAGGVGVGSKNHLLPFLAEILLQKYMPIALLLLLNYKVLKIYSYDNFIEEWTSKCKVNSL